MPEQRDWSWWSETKIDILWDYLRPFAIASKSARDRIYLDLFAGSYRNKRRDEEGYFPGSPQIAFNVEPTFTRVALFEKRDKAEVLRSSIQTSVSHNVRDWKVLPGDCNNTIDMGLEYIKNRSAPTIAFLDPCGLQVKWATLEKLAKWKDRGKPKIELFILFPEPALLRVIGAEVAKGKSSIDLVNSVYGTEDWVSIYQRRRSGLLDASNMRKELIKLYRKRLETILQYKKTHALGIRDNNIPIYTLIFATDHPVGDLIMEYIYESYSRNIIPMMQAKANIIRQANKGQDTLEGIGIPDIKPPHPTVRYELFDRSPPPQIESGLCFGNVTEMSPSLPFSWSED